MRLPEAISDTICDALVHEGYLVLDDFVPQQFAEQLYHYVRLIDRDEFSPAAIGRAQDKQHNTTIRNDKTRWLSYAYELEHKYLDYMDQLRNQLNRNLFLGIRDFEAHFAHFKTGNYYQRHLDAFRGKSNRKISTVFYLNPNWQKDYGGDLILYHPEKDEPLGTVSPKLGTLVIFLSEQFPHEVKPATQGRYSIAGWFRTDNPVL
jgi:SM-20-related protein